MMREKFCPKCGKKTDKFYNGLCQDCFLKTVTFISLVPDKIVLNQCRSCGKFYAGKKSGETKEEVIEKYFLDLFSKDQVEGINYRIAGNKLFVSLSSRVQKLEKREEKEVELIEKKITCEPCSLKNIGYYLSIVQVRAPPQIIDSLRHDFVEKIMLINRVDRNSFISKIEEVKNGLDFYIGSKSAASNAVNSLKKKYKARIKMSRKLTGSIRGKKAYRDTILFSVG